MNSKQLFHLLYEAKNEQQVSAIIERYPDIFASNNWEPLGGKKGNIGTVESQQSNATAALVEKLTNSIDAILMKKCLESGVDPKSSTAPRSMEQAVEWFFPGHQHWDLTDRLKSQALDIQIIADSEPRDTSNTSLIVYDNGEGQHPEVFKKTFLSLHNNNKNEVHFVQGRYNMGGSGAIMFCGRKYYQLIGSKRFRNDGDFGFTLVRQYPLSDEEEMTQKNHWYEYLVIDGCIPAFTTEAMELGLFQRTFVTGTIIKLYSYYTGGNRNIRRDMSRSINEFLYEPALPFYVVENKQRYPKERVLQAPIFGLRRQLSNSEYIEEKFSTTLDGGEVGKVKVEVYVFKNHLEGRSAKDTRDYVRREFFKNNMVVLFSLNGQVQGHFGSDFVSKTLTFNILKGSVLIHVDCTNMNRGFRQHLFMPDRERLRKTPESKALRQRLGKDLRNGQLGDIYKRRLAMLSNDSDDNSKLLKDLAENLPIDKDLRNLLSQTFKLDGADPSKKKRKPRKPKQEPREIEFNPKRYPTFFKLSGNKNGNTPVARIPLGGSKTIQFDSDVENQYFDRVEDPGDMTMAVLTHNANGGGDEPGPPNGISDLFSVIRRSPQEGKIKVVLEPTKNVSVGDDMQIKVDLNSSAHTAETFQEILWVKITEPPAAKPEKVSKPDESEKLGLPEYELVYQTATEGQSNDVLTWERIAESTSYEMSYDSIMFPLVEGDTLSQIYINMDSRVFKRYKSNFRNITLEQEESARKRYIYSVYFHTIFLYAISRQRK